MNILEKRIAGNHPVAARRRRPQQRGIVADAQPQQASFRRRNAPADAVDETIFADGHLIEQQNQSVHARHVSIIEPPCSEASLAVRVAE